MQEQQLEHEKDRVEREMIDKYNAGELVANQKSSSDKRVKFDAQEVESTPAHAPRKRLNISSVSASAEVIIFNWEIRDFILLFKLFKEYILLFFRQKLQMLLDGMKLRCILTQIK